MFNQLITYIHFFIVLTTVRGAYDPKVELVGQLAANQGTITCYPNNDSCQSIIDGNMSTAWLSVQAGSSAGFSINFVSQVLIGAVLIEIDPLTGSGAARMGTLDIWAGSEINGNPTTRCAGSLNGIDTNVRGGVFNCNVTGNALKVMCIGLCDPELKVRGVRVWSKYAISVDATA